MFAPVRPTLLIDVDGVLSLFGFDFADPPPGCPVWVDGTPHWISSEAGTHLARLARRFDCVWCTGWEDRAEDHLPRLLGLPGGWPHLRFDQARDGRERRGHWKLAAIDAHAGPAAPLAWIDDAHDEACARWAAARPGETLLVATNPAVGLTAGHVEQLEAWAAARSVAQARPPRGAGTGAA
jgi:HAD domain in Swiss Army Knife RNA repair proteins